MIHVYKHESDGAWKIKGRNCSVKAINETDRAEYISNGWVTDPSQLKAKPKAKAKVEANDNEE